MWDSVKIKKQARWVWDTCLDVVYPRTCVRCGRWVTEGPQRYTCPTCRDSIQWICEPVCEACGVPFFGKISESRKCAVCAADPPRFHQSRSLFLYRGTGARIVHALKYENGTWLGGEIGGLLHGNRSFEALFEGSSLIPVPLHPAKHRSRGYNQSIIIARGIQVAFPGVAIVDCLRRVRMTPSQTFLTREQRIRNMRGAFACLNRPPVRRKTILVDDVLTTGATLNAAAMALQRSGVGEISAFTLAHG